MIAVKHVNHMIGESTPRSPRACTLDDSVGWHERKQLHVIHGRHQSTHGTVSHQVRSFNRWENLKQAKTKFFGYFLA